MFTVSLTMTERVSGITDLDELLRSLNPVLAVEEFVFCTVQGPLQNYVSLQPLATFAEAEGLTIVLPLAQAQQARLAYTGVFRQITLTVHSSLDAVGLTAVVATRLAELGISANVIAACFHDHIFVQSEKADDALSALKAISGQDACSA